MAQIKFGTDGWRSVIAEDFTFDNVRRVAQAAADYSSANPIPDTEKKVIGGYYRVFLSNEFGRAVANVLATNDFDVVLTPEPTPTPSVSFAVKAMRAVGGVMITASHNPPIFNGFKLKAHFGGSAEAATCAAIEGLLDKTAPQLAPDSDQIAVENIMPAHYRAIKKLVDFNLIARSKLRFAHDPLF